jgi:hypothetical protein
MQWYHILLLATLVLILVVGYFQLKPDIIDLKKDIIEIRDTIKKSDLTGKDIKNLLIFTKNIIDEEKKSAKNQKNEN